MEIKRVLNFGQCEGSADDVPGKCKASHFFCSHVKRPMKSSNIWTSKA